MLAQVPLEIRNAVMREINARENKDVFLKGFDFVGGGCINSSGKLETSLGPFFLKWNNLNKYPFMLQAEADGLDLLRAGTVSFVPATLAAGETENFQFLILEWIAPSGRGRDFSRVLAEKLATLHRNTSETFGLPWSNYIGSLEQSNAPKESWAEFFAAERLMPQVSRAIDVGLLQKKHEIQFQSLYKKLPDLFPMEAPALLHGDLWNGNVIVNDEGLPYLIDPSVYYGSREVDLAMTRLFGGFDREFYEFYDECYPLYPGSQERIDLYNLYPLLVHVNLFGSAYVPDVIRVLKIYE
jgi:fructosamine-3-kinase